MPERTALKTHAKATVSVSNTIVEIAKQAIDDKWQALGGAPGAPTVPGPSGAIRIKWQAYYREYANGRIYTSGDAFWVKGAILARYLQLGGPASWLGMPRSDELDFSEGGKVSVFEHGSIYWWPDTGTREVNNVVVHYTGLHCFGETDVDHGTDDDEPYATFGITSADGGQQVIQTRVYDDVDGGEGRFDVIELYRGRPSGLAISTILQENSDGNTALSRQAMSEAVNKAGPALVGATTLIPVVGPVLGPLASAAFQVFKKDLIDALNSFIETTLGYRDRPLGADLLQLTPKQMVLLATRPEGHAQFNEIPWRFETTLMSRFGASYKAYFNIFPA
jgi:hypothetical protein